MHNPKVGSSSLLSGTSKGSDILIRAFYVLYCLHTLFRKYKKHYTGFTTDIIERLKSHNDLGKGWTSRYRPWKIIYTKTFESKTEALAYEKSLKTGIGRDFIKALLH
ncbi:MAG: GIY-YIG nuclease family protein [Chitinophagaceae bacterium]|nr:GIY-YIG nuclease family protein [Chitinophagaceae bacterium]